MESYCVLVVDEDDVLRRVITGILQTEGYRVLSTASIREAQDLMDVFRIDALLVDASLPKRQGLALLLEAKVQGDPMARLLLTNGEMVPEAVRAMGTGLAHGLVLKPVIIKDLIDTVTRMLGQFHPGDVILQPQRAAAIQVYDVSRTA